MIKPTFSSVLAVYAILLVFGLAYNWLISLAERKGYLEGFTWLSVVVGVGVTLLLMGIIAPRASMLFFGAFCFSGAPMSFGAVQRYLVARKAGQDHDRQAPPMA